MKRIRGLVRSVCTSTLAGLILLGVSLSGMQALAKSEAFSHFFVFGDSLSDTGNYYRLSGGSPPPPYAGGRFCNGPLWVEYLAANVGLSYDPAENFAVGGATTGHFNSNNSVEKQYPGLLDEVALYQAGTESTEPERALYVVEAGANDFFIALVTGASPEAVIANGVNNTLEAIQQLSAAGARQILVMNLPDLGVTPMAYGMNLSAPLTQVCAAYNQVLGMALDRLEQAGIPTMRLDAFAALDDMAKNPAAYGFSDVTTPALYAPPGSNPDQFLFWDPVHPTTGAHKVLAAAAEAQLLNTYSPSHGKGTPEAKVNSLHGLVNASLHQP